MNITYCRHLPPALPPRAWAPFWQSGARPGTCRKRACCISALPRPGVIGFSRARRGVQRYHLFECTSGQTAALVESAVQEAGRVWHTRVKSTGGGRRRSPVFETLALDDSPGGHAVAHVFFFLFFCFVCNWFKEIGVDLVYFGQMVDLLLFGGGGDVKSLGQVRVLHMWR